MRKLVTIILAMTMLLSLSATAMADELKPNEVGVECNAAQSEVKLTVVDSVDMIIATVPVELPLIVDIEGEWIVPDNYRIINHLTHQDLMISKISFKSDVIETSDVSPENQKGFTMKLADVNEYGAFELLPDYDSVDALDGKYLNELDLVRFASPIILTRGSETNFNISDTKLTSDMYEDITTGYTLGTLSFTLDFYYTAQ